MGSASHDLVDYVTRHVYVTRVRYHHRNIGVICGSASPLAASCAKASSLAKPPRYASLSHEAISMAFFWISLIGVASKRSPIYRLSNYEESNSQRMKRAKRIAIVFGNKSGRNRRNQNERQSLRRRLDGCIMDIFNNSN
ncbi:hypothetical protein ALC56_00134 [Trachymyrmex septentrionalis]|uniref:Uncharacterized protein n=1 Tax=Trachymyrmex septentrionalis TaxID=34720 RepID=A0A195FXP1_9HYME|nr:hypothetical protein ALC56_00134 [Trachymyrmex septentrionalis]